MIQSQTYNPVWNDDTQAITAPIQNVVADEWLMSTLPEVDVVEAGLPCSAASVAGRAKNKTPVAEAHESVGHLVAPFIQLIQKLNPAVVVLENVKPYASTGSMWILRHSLRDLGYEVHERILDSKEFNTIEGRERLCMVAVTEGVEFDFASLALPERQKQTVNDILDPIADDDPSWRSYSYLHEHEAKQKAKGNGFRVARYDGTEDNLCVIGAGYAKIRSTEPKISHPHNPDLMRQLTVAEHAKAKGIPPELTTGMTATIGHQLLGQSVCHRPFVAVGKLIANSLKAGIKAAASNQSILKVAA